MSARRVKDRERGSLSLFAAVLMLAFLALLGLVVDGGYTLAARARAATHAENAARAGANALSETDLRAGRLRIDPAAAALAAQRYLDAAGVSGQVSAGPGEVTVVVTVRQRTAVLPLVGIRSLDVRGQATARPLRSVGQPP